MVKQWGSDSLRLSAQMRNEVKGCLYQSLPMTIGHALRLLCSLFAPAEQALCAGESQLFANVQTQKCPAELSIA